MINISLYQNALLFSRKECWNAGFELKHVLWLSVKHRVV